MLKHPEADLLCIIPVTRRHDRGWSIVPYPRKGIQMGTLRYLSAGHRLQPKGFSHYCRAPFLSKWHCPHHMHHWAPSTCWYQTFLSTPSILAQLPPGTRDPLDHQGRVRPWVFKVGSTTPYTKSSFTTISACLSVGSPIISLPCHHIVWTQNTT